MARSDAEKNRQQILEAFARLVERADTPPTMSAVVRESGLGRGTVYRHFSDIGSMAFAQLDEGFRTLFTSARIQISAATKEQIVQAVLDLATAYFKFSLLNKGLLRTPECQNSQAYSLARSTLRQLIAQALQIGAEGASDTAIQSHAIACLAEAEYWPSLTTVEDSSTMRRCITILLERI